jgi:hypothetical protein
VPKATFCAAAELALFDHLVGAGNEVWRHSLVIFRRNQMWFFGNAHEHFEV